MNTVSSFRICSFNLRGFSKNDPKLQMIKLLTATKFHDIIGMLDTHLNQEEVDTMVKNNKQTFQDFHDPILIPSQTRGIMVLLRKSCPFKLVKYKDVTSNCLSVLLKSASKQELEIAFVYNSNDEADKISNLSKALDQTPNLRKDQELI